MGLAIFKGCPLDRLIVLLDHFKHILSFFYFLFSSSWLFQCIEASTSLSFLRVPSGAETTELDGFDAVWSCLQ